MAGVNLNDIIYLTPNSEQREPAVQLPDGRVIFVRHPSAEELERIYALTQTEISPSVASWDTVKKADKHNPDTFWGVFLATDNTRNNVSMIGYYSFLHLNESGRVALEGGTFDAVHLDFSQLVEEGKRPSVIYVWAILARKVARIATPLVAKALGKNRYGGVPIYATAATLGGLNSMKGYGFVGARPSEKGVGDLFRLDPEPGQSDKTAAA